MKGDNMNNMYLARRSFIKGLASIGLLSAVQVEKIFAQTTAPLRVLFIPLQHGWGTGIDTVANGNITGSEFDFTLPHFWQPFNAIREDCVFIDGLRGTFWGNAHDVSYSEILTSAVPINASDSNTGLGGPFPRPIGPSIDYVLSEEHYNRDALRFSARFASWGASHHPLSFNNSLSNLSYRTSARSAYTGIFEGMQNGDDQPPAVDPGLVAIFPHLSQETQKIISNIGDVTQTERNKLLSYLDAVRSLESQLVGQVPTPAGTATLKRIPQSGDNLATDITSYFDMVRVAFTNDTHRVAVLGIGEETTQYTWTNSENRTITGRGTNQDYDPGCSGDNCDRQISDFHQTVCHYNGKGANSAASYIGWTRWNAQQVVNFVQELRDTIDVDGNRLIDNTVIVLTGEVGNGSHDNRHKPHIVIGGGNRFTHGRWLRTPRADARDIGSRDASGQYQSIQQATSWLGGQHSKPSQADLYVKIAQMAGMNISSFGIDSLNSGELDL